jgi:CubicO group peptidase (beta-lactamase class C family)
MTIRRLAALLPLLAAPFTRSAAQSVACTTSPAVDSIVAGILSAVNDGSYRAIDGTLTRYWLVDRMPPAAASSIRTRLAWWHWQSGRLADPRACERNGAVGVLVRNTLTGETDSVSFVVPEPGKVARFTLTRGVRVPVGAADTASDAGRARALGALVHALGDAGAFAGEVVFARDGSILLHEAAGVANRETGRPAKVGDRYSMASTGKWITASAIMRLAEEGRLSLDDSLGKYLRAGERPAGAAGVRLKHVLSHTDGMVRGSDTLVFTPGTRFGYENYGYYLLGEVIERVTGVPFDEYLARSVFQRAGMTATRRLVLSAPDPRLPPAYVFTFDSGGAHFTVNPQAQTIPATGAGGMFTTAMDLYRFADAFRAGRIVSLASVDSMRARKLDLGATDYGYGVDWYRGNGIWGHSGGLPGAESDVELYGDSGYLLVVLGNTGTNDVIRRRVLALVGRRPACPTIADRDCAA